MKIFVSSAYTGDNIDRVLKRVLNYTYVTKPSMWPALRKRAGKTHGLLDRNLPNFYQTCNGLRVIGGVIACIIVAILPFIVECQCSE